MSENIKSIENAFEIIDLLYETGSMGVSELSTELKLPKTTTHRVLKTLRNLNIVDQDKQDIYSLGYSMYKYSQGIKQDQALINTAMPAMDTFSSQTGETINLGVLVGDEVVVIHSSTGEFYNLQPTLSQSSPLYCSGMGKVYLSEFNDDELSAYYDQGLVKRTVNSIIQKEDYEKEKEHFLRTRLSYDNEEYEYGLSCISTAVFDPTNKLIAALSVSGPTSRLKHKGIDNLEKKLLETSIAITESMK